MVEAGRRSVAGEEPRVPINLKVLPSLRDKLKRSAEKAGRTVSNEIETRLTASFGDPAGEATPETEDLLKCIREAVAYAENRAMPERMPRTDNTLKPWPTDDEVRITARRAILELVRFFMSDDESKQSAVLRYMDGSEIEDFDYGRAIAHAVLLWQGKIATQPPVPVIPRRPR